MVYVFVILSLIVMTGCEQKPQTRQYTEVVIEAPQPAQPANPHAGMDMSAMMGGDPHAGLDMAAAPMMASANAENKNKFAWNVPQGWVEEEGKGMRLATFHTADNPKEIDVSLVSLGGMAGGLEANLKRWLGQINVQISDEQLQSFIQSAKDNIFDLTQLQKKANPETKSMIAAVINLADATVFVKMTGSIEAVSKHKDKFTALVKSVHSK